jgi:poly-D-alanine transfer protein DltD
MGAADVVNSLSEFSDKEQGLPLPERESHANALAALPISQRQEIWEQVTRESGQTQQPITASGIKTVIDREEGRPKPILGEEATHLAGDNAKSNDMSASNTYYIKQIKKALITAKSQELRIEVRGSWLVRHGLEDAWRQLRDRPDWVINNQFKDTLTLNEAKLLGLFR